jgi:TPR repeat protein
MRAVFISYRRDDAEGEAGRLFADLATQFGKSNVFMDVTGITPGRDFRKVVDQNVGSCGVLLALIGKGWVDAKDDTGRRRLDDPMDFVRLETASALKRDIPVIPVLLRGTSMPKAEQLPEDMRDLVYRNGVELTHARWQSDVQCLVDAIRGDVEGSGTVTSNLKSEATGRPSPPDTKSSWRWRLVLLSVATLALVVAVVTVYEYRKAQEAQEATAQTAARAAAAEAAARQAAEKKAAAKEADAQRAAAREAAARQAAEKEAAAKEIAGKEAAAKQAAAARTPATAPNPLPEANTTSDGPTDPAAQAALGDEFYFGRNGRITDDAEAVKWYRKAAEQGNAEGQTYLGVMYSRGVDGLPKDYAEAVKWYQKAAEQGYALAQNNLGRMYERGYGGLPKDEAEAVKWYRKAAEQGLASGQTNLGRAYQNGLGGLPKDNAEALKWFRKAAAQGDAIAKTEIRLMTRHLD